jgi:hypothetical protein
MAKHLAEHRNIEADCLKPSKPKEISAGTVAIFALAALLALHRVTRKMMILGAA